MRRNVLQLASWLTGGALLGAVAAGVVQAQDQTGAAKTFRDTQAPALSAGPTTNPTADTVPGYAGPRPDLEAYENDPDGLKNAGSATYYGGNQTVDLTNTSTDRRNGAGVSATDTWLGISGDVAGDPMSRLNPADDTTTGTEGEECRDEQRTETTTSHSIYTCETGVEYYVETHSCTEHYEPNVQTYAYTCEETYNYATHAWVRSPGCDAAANDGNCTAGSRTCTARTSPRTETYTCSEGYTERTTTTTNSYSCQEGYTEGAPTPASCEAAYNPNIQYTSEISCALPTPANGNQDQCWEAWGRYGLLNGCTLIGESWDAAGGHWATYGCNPADVGGSYDESSCSGMGGCSQTGSTCVEGPATYYFNGAAVYRDCWRYRYDYVCTGGRVNAPGCSPPPGATLTGSSCGATDASGNCTLWNRDYSYETTTTVRDPAAGCSPPPGASLTGSSCGATDASGACTLWNRTYQYEAPDEAGPCAAYSTNYSCQGDTGGRWVPDGACNYSGMPNCRATGTVCTDGPSTRDIGGVPVNACWSREITYECTMRRETSNCQVPDGCSFVEDTCLDDPAAGPGGECLTTDHKYACTKTTTTTTTVNTCQSKMCLGDSCFTMDREANDEFPQVFSQLSAMKEAGEDYATNPDFQIFKGSRMRCKKAVLGFRNCCKDSGWGVDLGIAHCDQQEIALMGKQEAKAVHYVGTYCSNKSLFGCLEKSMVYCAFEGSLGRIVQEAGRPQIGKTWGTAKDPDCSGFTVDQFQQLDLSNVDFSEFYQDKLKDFTSPDPGSTATRIQQSISNLYDNGGNPNGPQ